MAKKTHAERCQSYDDIKATCDTLFLWICNRFIGGNGVNKIVSSSSLVLVKSHFGIEHLKLIWSIFSGAEWSEEIIPW